MLIYKNTKKNKSACFDKYQLYINISGHLSKSFQKQLNSSMPYRQWNEIKQVLLWNYEIMRVMLFSKEL